MELTSQGGAGDSVSGDVSVRALRHTVALLRCPRHSYRWELGQLHLHTLQGGEVICSTAELHPQPDHSLVNCAQPD